MFNIQGRFYCGPLFLSTLPAGIFIIQYLWLKINTRHALFYLTACSYIFL